MTNYIMNINSQSNGDHKIHKMTCDRLPNLGNRLYLGDFQSCHDAVREAKKYDPEADGCLHCSPECNEE